MKHTIYLIGFILLSSFFAQEVNAQRRDMKAFEHLAASVEVGTTGFGLQAATSLHPNLALRGGFTVLPYKTSYTYEGYGDNGDFFIVPMDIKVNMFNAKLLVDFFPKRDSRFHITGGFFFGNNKILKVDGYSDYDEPIEIGDIWIRPDGMGRVSAWIDNRAIKPYLGLGFGRTIPRKRVGFKFELGTIFQGAPKVKSNNPILNDAGFEDTDNDLNKFLSDYFKVYPYLSFQLSYRIFSK